MILIKQWNAFLEQDSCSHYVDGNRQHNDSEINFDVETFVFIVIR